MQRWVFPAGVLVLTACASPPSLEVIDAWVRATEARTVHVEPDYTLFSPYGVDGTKQYVETVEREIAALQKLFGTELEEPIPVWLRPIAETGPQEQVDGKSVSLSIHPPDPPDGVLGRAGAQGIIVRVAPVQTVRLGGGLITAVTTRNDYVRVLRHELAHVFAFRAGIMGSSWLNEGIAYTVDQYLPDDEKGLVPAAAPPLLTLASRAPSEARDLSSLLSWRSPQEDLDSDDQAACILSSAFITFLLERSQRPFPEALRNIAAMPDAELLALENEWGRWLESRGSNGGRPDPAPQDELEVGQAGERDA